MAVMLTTEMASASSSSVSSSSSSNFESKLTRLNKRFRSTIRKRWSFRRTEDPAKRQRSHSDIGVYGFEFNDELQNINPRQIKSRTPPPSCSGCSTAGPYKIYQKHYGVTELLAKQSLQLAGPFPYIKSTGNFIGGVGPGAAPSRSAPPTPHQLEAPRSPAHSVNKYDKNGSKNSWSANESPGGTEGSLAAPPSSSKARQKKFNRHFPQAAQDERVLNYYSCALVGDILLQGHLYITKNYFAFYSNVFGYVTKLLIPTASVVRVSKEKMARIIPNAVGVTTIEDKHVFGSLLSRDTTYKLMTQVWKASPIPVPESSPKELRLGKIDMEASELSLDDESSWCSQSGGEESIGGTSKSGLRLTPPIRAHRTPSPRNKTSDIAISTTPIDEAPSEKIKRRPIKAVNEIDTIGPTLNVARKVTANAILAQNGSAIIRNSKRQRSASAPGSSTLVSGIVNVLPKHSTLLVVATILLVILFISAGFLLYRIGIVRDKLGNSIALEDNVLLLKKGDDFYSEILKWHSQLHSKSALQVHDFLNSNLEQIAKVRQSLETLSTLIGGITNDNTNFPSSGFSGSAMNSDKLETVQTVGMSHTMNDGDS
ncbi:uncharacterized protein LOC143909370 isoform X2 [Arctopsyche grandis]|uniref:uncharacterized protein LOC143909370 isoform X2 n=1 Tax=Arctopsyche grandis TaxID=121162 RepID=UPI00406D9C6D